MTDTSENTRNYYRQQGVEAERERIIKIISEWNLPVNQGTYTVDNSVKSLIALIKGENK